MASEEQLTILKKGVKAWNAWRKANRAQEVDLSGANLLGVNLSEADLSAGNLTETILSGADLSRADLVRADLSKADLSRADLTRAGLLGARLTRANLSGANLTGANLTWAGLSGANLSGANLTGAEPFEADLSEANLYNATLHSTVLIYANFTNTILGWTSIANCDLSSAKSLEKVNHDGPSTIGIDTLYRSGGKIPDSFLRKCGVPEDVIEHLLPLIRSGSPIQFYSCFISYSSKDQTFADRLYADLQSKGVRCWFAPEDLKIGDKFRIRIDESIRLHDKLLLVLSSTSVSSDWVEKEVETAMERERQEKRTVLFPIRLDDAVMEIPNGWPADIRRNRHIGDFRKWKNHDDYQKAFDRLLRDLKADQKPKPPA
jgi:hypothetical protein